MSEAKFITRGALRAIGLAGQEAQRHHRDQVSVLDLLLGLVMLQDDLASRVLHDLKVEAEQVQLLVEQHTETASESSSDIHEPNARIMPILEAANRVADRLGNNYVSNEHLLLGLLDDPDGAYALAQLGVTPKQVGNRLNELLRERPAQVTHGADLDLETLHHEIFRSSPVIADVRQLVTRTHFPVRTSSGPALEYRLCSASPQLGQDAEGTSVIRVYLEFAYPVCAVARSNWYDNQWLGIDNSGHRARGPRYLWRALMEVGRKVREIDPFRLPVAFSGLLGGPLAVTEKAVLDNDIHWEELLADPRWETVVASGLHFKVAYWAEGQVPVGWAISEDNETAIVIATLGVQRSPLLEILGSLVVIDQRDDTLIERLQVELETTRDEFGPKRHK